MKHSSTLVTLAVLLLVATASVPQTPPSNAAAGAISDSAIVEKLREIVTIRQKLAESNELLVQHGKGERDGRYELALAEARLALARELGQRNEQIAALQDALKVYQLRLEDAKRRVAIGATPPSEVETIRAAVLEAEVRLLREQGGSRRP